MKLNLEETLQNNWICTYKGSSGWECNASAIVGYARAGNGMCLAHALAYLEDVNWPEIQLREGLDGDLRDLVITKIKRLHPDCDKPVYPTKIGCRTIMPYADRVRFVGVSDAYELTLDHLRHLVSECERLAKKPKVRYMVSISGKMEPVIGTDYQGPYTTREEAESHIEHRMRVNNMPRSRYEIREVPA